MTKEEQAIQDALEAKFKEVQDALKVAQDSGAASKAEILKLHAAIKEQGEAFDLFVEAQKNKEIKSFGAEMQDFLIANKDTLADIRNKKSGTIMFVPKVVGDMSTAAGAIIGTVPANNDASLNPVNLRNDNMLLALADITNTSAAIYPYTEVLPKDGDFAFVAEGGVKPQVDFKWETRYATPKKIAAHEILSEEVMTDVPRMMSVAKDLLKKKHDLFK